MTYEQSRKHYFEKLLDQRKRSLDYWLREDAYERIEEVSAEKAYIEDAINALEKQIPKRPTHEATRYINNTCPYCKNVIDNIDRYGNRILEPFCKFCGQEIDWSEQNDE